MSPNHFDQASRYAVKLDPKGFLHWLLEEAMARFHFHGWLDTRTIPFPGHPERICDTVAELIDQITSLAWALVVEFQSEPDADLFGRLLEYLGRPWRELRPTGIPGHRFQVVAAVVNLTGTGRTSREMVLSPKLRTVLDVREINLQELDAAPLLEAIATGRHPRALLPWIPLLRGGTAPGIMERWKEIAAVERDSRRRGDYAGLAIVLADLVDARPAWKKALEGWNVKQSAQVLEWQAEARREGRQEGRQEGILQGQAKALLDLLKGRFKKVPADVTNHIKAAKDLTEINEWFQAAITIPSIQEFRKLLS